MTATVKRLEVKIDKLQDKNKDILNKTPSSSLKPGKFSDTYKTKHPNTNNPDSDKSGGHKPPTKSGEPHKAKTKKGHWIYYCKKCNNWRRHDTDHDEWKADKNAFNTKHGIDYGPKKRVKFKPGFKGTLAEMVIQDESLDTSSTPEDDSTVETVETPVPTGSFHLMNGLWLAEDINK